MIRMMRGSPGGVPVHRGFSSLAEPPKLSSAVRGRFLLQKNEMFVKRVPEVDEILQKEQLFQGESDQHMTGLR